MISMVGGLALCATSQGAEVSVWHAYRGQERAGLEQASTAWGEANDVTVDLVALPFGAFDSKLETAIPRGNGPDLFVAAHGNLGKWSSMGLIQTLPDALAGHRPATRDALQTDGTTWGLPLAYKSVVLLYDPEVVTEVPATTDALIEAAKRLTGGQRYGLAYMASEPYFHGVWMHGFGADAIRRDGQVTLGDTVLKHSARKVQRLRGGKVLAGFAGSTADALALSERFEAKLEEYAGALRRSAVELAKDWRTDRTLRQLQALLIVADEKEILLISGNGDVIEPDDGIATIGSGGSFALAAARALVRDPKLSAREIAEEALRIAAGICLHTNEQITVEEVGS